MVRRRVKIALVVFALLASCASTANSQRQQAKQTKPETELAKLRNEYIDATKDYKASLGRLIAIYEREVTRAEAHLTQSRALFEQGLISKTELNKSEVALASAKDKVAETSRLIGSADTQIAETLLEAEAEKHLSKTRLSKGGLIRAASYTRYAGTGGWVLSDAWKVQQFFFESFKKQLPVAVFGQGAIHDRWRLDHRNSMDVSLHPDGPEGQALLNFLRSNGIPFLAFRSAIPGTATGPHIHIGHPSHRY